MTQSTTVDPITLSPVELIVEMMDITDRVQTTLVLHDKPVASDPKSIDKEFVGVPLSCFSDIAMYSPNLTPIARAAAAQEDHNAEPNYPA